MSSLLADRPSTVLPLLAGLVIAEVAALAGAVGLVRFASMAVRHV